MHIHSFEREIKLFNDLLREIKVFIKDNPSGTFILSKMLMRGCSEFECNHVCGAIDKDNSDFMRID